MTHGSTRRIPNTLRESALRVSAWGQTSFDVTPQLARFLYLALAAVREQGLDLVDAVSLLKPGSEIRREVLLRSHDPFILESLAYFDSLRASRQEELAASTLARLEAFVFDPSIRNILTGRPAIDLSDVITNHRLFLVNLELYRPLLPDDVKLLGRLLINDILAHVFARGPGQRSPVYLILDEVQTFATHDLCAVLDLGRELGLHCILAHQYLEQLRDEDGTGLLYHSVMKSARSRMVFGGLSVEELNVLVPELFLDQYDDMQIKNELTSLELEPIESTRTVNLNGWNQGWNTAQSAGESLGTSRGESAGSSRQHGESESHVSSSSYGHSSGTVETTGETLADDGTVLSEQVSEGLAEMDSYGYSTTDSRSESESRGTHHSTSRVESKGVQRAKTEGISGGVTHSQSTVPFYEYKKSRIVSSRTFVSEAEFLTRELQKVKSQRTAAFVIKTPHSKALFLRGPFVGIRRLALPVLQAARRRIFGAAFYHAVVEVPSLPALRTANPQGPFHEASVAAVELRVREKSLLARRQPADAQVIDDYDDVPLE